MRIAIAAFTRGGAELAGRLQGLLSAEGHAVSAAVSQRVDAELEVRFSSASAWTESVFDHADALIFVGATGIAVRAIAPHLKSKLTDPAVVCVDEKGRFAVSLVSGHFGGANALARHIAFLTNGQPVISTATDVNGLFSVDAWIARSGLTLINPRAVRSFSTALLEGREVGLCSEFPIEGELPEGVVKASKGAAGLYIGIREDNPFAETVIAVPHCLHLGIGCKKGTSAVCIEAAVEVALQKQHIYPEAVASVASIDLKREEQGLLAFCKDRKLPIFFYTAEELLGVAIPANARPLHHSEFVRRVTGVDNVCERAALMRGSELTLRRFASDGVTVAAAMENTIIRFSNDSAEGNQ